MRYIQDKEFLFHGDRIRSPYFEGWYYRITTEQMSLAIIVGITKNTKNDHAFIQTIDSISQSSQYIPFPIDSINYSTSPFHIEIENHHFYQHAIILRLQNAPIPIIMNVNFHETTPLQFSMYAPTIMGPFTYLPMMECIHSINSLHHKVEGVLQIHSQTIPLTNAIGYIEKDRGTSFPKHYIWLQSNLSNVKGKTCFFLSIATIPVFSFSFMGCIGIFLRESTQLVFATYYGAKVQRLKNTSDGHRILITQGKYLLSIKVTTNTQYPLFAPNIAYMKREVKEGLDALMTVNIYKKGKLLHHVLFRQVGCEVSPFDYQINE